jgi:hypothetical protein
MGGGYPRVRAGHEGPYRRPGSVRRGPRDPRVDVAAAALEHRADQQPGDAAAEQEHGQDDRHAVRRRIGRPGDEHVEVQHAEDQHDEERDAGQQRRNARRPPAHVVVALAAEVRDDGERRDGHQQQHAERAEVGQPREELEHRIGAGKREHGHDAQGERGLRERREVGRARARVDVAEEPGQHALAPERERVAGDRVVEGEQRREEAGGEEQRRRVAPERPEPVGARDEEHGGRVGRAAGLEAPGHQRVRVHDRVRPAAMPTSQLEIA